MTQLKELLGNVVEGNKDIQCCLTLLESGMCVV